MVRPRQVRLFPATGVVKPEDTTPLIRTPRVTVGQLAGGAVVV